mgnify:CR=1 FL=1
MALDGSVLAEGDGLGVASPRSSQRGASRDTPTGSRPPEMVVSYGGIGLVNVRLVHTVGFCTDVSALRRLPIDRVVAAIVSTDGDAQDAAINDSEVMSSALILRALPLLYPQPTHHGLLPRSPRGRSPPSEPTSHDDTWPPSS